MNAHWTTFSCSSWVSEVQQMFDETGPDGGTVGEVVGSMLGVQAPFDPGTGLLADPAWDDDTLDPNDVHQYLCALAKDDAARDFVRGEWFLKGMAARVWEPLGMGTFSEYAERLFGYSPRKTWEILRVANALRELPLTGAALREGRLRWSVVRELTRVVLPDTEARWLAAVDGLTVREVEKKVADLDRGDDPDDPPNPRARRSVLRFEVNAETKALLDAARTEIVRDAGHSLNDDEMLQLMARIVLGREASGAGTASSDAGRSNYQVHMTVCPKCRAGDQRAAGDEVRVRPAAVEAALCDAIVVEAPEPDAGETDECPRGKNGPGVGRASQTIPPAIRRAVVQRDKGRCTVPGCRHHHHVDAHHIDLRSEGGRHELDNLILLCSVHHTAAHEGRLLIRGRPCSGLEFLHADGSRYGAPVPPSRAKPAMQDMGVFRRAHSCLSQLGFKQGQIQVALDDIRAHVGTDTGPADAEAIILAALRRLPKGVVTARDEGPGYVAAAP